jgi:hypothetical protein
VNIWIACQEAWNSPQASWKEGEIKQCIAFIIRGLLKSQNLDPEQGDSVATLPVFIQSP